MEHKGRFLQVRSVGFRPFRHFLFVEVNTFRRIDDDTPSNLVKGLAAKKR